MAGIGRFLKKAGKGALSAGLGIGGNVGIKPDDVVDAVKTALNDDEVAERLAQIVAAGLLMAAEGDEDGDEPNGQ